MKKISFVLLSTVVASQNIQANPGSFDGPYVGAQLVFSQRADKTSFPSPDITTDAGSRYIQDPVNKSQKTNSLAYGLYAGYGKDCNGFYWGGEFSIQHPEPSERRKYDVDSTLTTAGIPFRGGGYIKTEYKRGMIFGIAPRIGAVIAKTNLFYFKVGIEYSRDKLEIDPYIYVHSHIPGGMGAPFVTDSVGVRETRSKSKHQICFVPAIGYERAFGKLLARVEYGYNFGGKIKAPVFHDRQDNPIGSNAVSVKTSAHVVKAGLAYKF